MKIDAFIPCFIDQFYPETGFNMVRILEKLGHEVHYNENQTCCGQVAFNSGFWEEAKKEEIKGYRFTGIIKDETIEQVMAAIKLASSIDEY